jgi:ATPase subunit of ABC transporter with duplicated ATPase domains
MSTSPSLDATRSWVLELYGNRLDDYKQKYSEYVFQVVECLEQEFNDIECIQYETAYLQNIMLECNVTKTEIFEKGYSKELLTVLELVKKT